MKSNLNRLANANSPYLRQHADNPVDWFPWGEEALAKARKENKPLIISIGYAACHWCHVMAHESFLDADVASFMNDHFVCIKIDREERPDIDQIYMEAVQHITGEGGWPLHAFTLPDGRPFHGGTYFPRHQWLDLLKRIQSVYENHFADLQTQAEILTSAIQTNLYTVPPSAENNHFSREQYDSFIDGWENLMDKKEGGFTKAPKFPMPVVWEFLLQYYYITGNESALNYVNNTLEAMAKGGIYDQIAGGFSRYSTDKSWKVPHFEKMLYDNAQLISLYARAYQVTNNLEFAGIVRESIAFCERELMNGEGAFFSSLDADSEGDEGKYYTFTVKEFKESVDPEVSRLLAGFYQVTDEGNWEHGRNILWRKRTFAEFTLQNDMSGESFEKILRRAHEQLMALRAQRIRPSTDEKIITAWNALMIKAYIDAFHALGTAGFLNSAIRLAHFIEQHMFTADGNLLRSYRDGNAMIPAFLDDYSLLAEALIRLYEATFDIHWLDLSQDLTRLAIAHFSDPDNSLFYYTSDLSETLIARKHEIPDTVIPSSNSVMAHVLIKHGHFYDNPLYLSRAIAILKQVVPDSSSHNPYYAYYAMALGLIAYPVNEIAIAGEKAHEKNLILQRHYLPTSLFLGGAEENLPLLKDKLVPNATKIYVCRDKTCSLPVDDAETALNLLR
jgi:uncharacterized protein YyaL (SSP411 family)